AIILGTTYISDRIDLWRRLVFNFSEIRVPTALNLLILRTPGDEASLALSWVGMWNFVVRFLWGRFIPIYNLLCSLANIAYKYVELYYSLVIVAFVIIAGSLTVMPDGFKHFGFDKGGLFVCMLSLCVFSFVGWFVLF